jgi:selenium metabolism protein YedF
MATMLRIEVWNITSHRKEWTMADEKIVVYVDGDTLGKGSEELGRVLMKNFLHTLPGITPKPWRVILISTGVKLAVGGHECVPVLKSLTDQGTEVLSCGTCLDYFGLKDDLSAGRASNMNEIATSFMAATKVIKA